MQDFTWPINAFDRCNLYSPAKWLAEQDKRFNGEQIKQHIHKKMDQHH